MTFCSNNSNGNLPSIVVLDAKATKTKEKEGKSRISFYRTVISMSDGSFVSEINCNKKRMNKVTSIKSKKLMPKWKNIQ